MIWNFTGGNFETVFYPMHPCSMAEIDAFDPPENQATEDRVRSLTSHENLFCLDQKAAQLVLQGTWRSPTDSTGLEFRIAPCASRIISFDGSALGADSECVWD